VTVSDAEIATIFLHDGQQPATRVFDALAEYIHGAERSLDLAIYDAHFRDGMGEQVIAALDAAEARGVQIRAVYNVDRSTGSGSDSPAELPAMPGGIQPLTGPSLLQKLAQAVPSEAIPGVPDLMHHKYVVRDASAVWTGSTNWTTDAWTRMENMVIVVPSVDIAAAYAHDFEQLWTKRHVDRTGTFDVTPITLVYEGAPMTMRAMFSPGRGRNISSAIARRIARAEHHVRIASPVLTSAKILAALGERLDEGDLDAKIVVDGPQMRQVCRQWEHDPRTAWKVPMYEHVANSGCLVAKESTPWRPGEGLHNFMHAKVVVVDDGVVTGSYNCSRSGERNAENVLEIESALFAGRCSAFVDAVHARYEK
jgi:phosphatidylserine/phosphatidylglycerophosphate/cardiolipin synthase-like enzyme